MSLQLRIPLAVGPAPSFAVGPGQVKEGHWGWAVWKDEGGAVPSLPEGPVDLTLGPVEAWEVPGDS